MSLEKLEHLYDIVSRKPEKNHCVLVNVLENAEFPEYLQAVLKPKKKQSHDSQIYSTLKKSVGSSR